MLKETKWFWDENMTPLQILRCLIYLQKDQLLQSHEKQETLKMEAGDLIPYSFETPSFIQMPLNSVHN